MPVHPEERRIAGLLRELIVQSGITLESLENRLDWKPGRLPALLEGHLRLSFEDVLEVLPVLGTTPTDFFAWLYGFDPREAVAERNAPALLSGSPPAQEILDRRFDQSLRVVKNALNRRRLWKEERSQS
jgi:transcriptional regulator with XRE-family HTH domain